jgi:glyoxylase-like metal-dependent hydrolase (beta-lactamase superfamily II)
MAEFRRQEAQPATDEIVELAPGVLRTQLPIMMPGLGHVNCYVLEDERGFALVDPGLPGPEAWKGLELRMKQAGVPLERVHTVVVTHSHPDHFGGAGRLQAISGADIVSHASFRLFWERWDEPDMDPDQAAELDGEAAYQARMEHWDRPTPWGGQPYRPVNDEERNRIREEMSDPLAVPRPNVRLEDADHVMLARRQWVAVHTPGHTPDHLCLYDPVEGLLLSGDHVLPTITPHISGVGSGPDPLADFNGSLKRMHTLPGVRLVLPAHGTPFTDLYGRVDAIHEHHAERLHRLRQAAAAEGQPTTVNGMMKHLFSERAWGSMAESETYAHLEHLRLAGEATTERRDDGQLYYRITEAGLGALAGESSGA